MDLNKEVAEKVMGWNRIMSPLEYRLGNELKYDADRWNPLEDLDQCFEVVEKVCKQGFYLNLTNLHYSWQVQFHFVSDYKIKSEAEGHTPNEAILKAALRAVKRK